MQMPLVFAVAAFILGVLISSWISRTPWWIAGITLALIGLAVAAGRARHRTYTDVFSWLLLMWIGATCHLWQRGEATDDLGQIATKDFQPLVFRAEIVGSAVWRPNVYYRTGQPENERWRTQWLVRCFAIRRNQQWQDVSALSTFSVAGHVEHLMPGDFITVYGSCAAISAPTNPGENDLREYYQSEHQFVMLRADGLDQISLDRSSWRRPVARATAHIVRSINRSIHRQVTLGQASLAAALVFGQRQQLDWDDQQQLLSTGTLHMLAISGMHIELVVLALWMLCAILGLQQRTTLIVVAITIGFYALITGANPPVLRAVFVVWAICIARWQGRRRGLPNLLAFAGLCILAMRTTWMSNVGVQLSFLAVATIAVYARTMDPRAEKRSALESVLDESRTATELWTRWIARWSWQMFVLSFWVWLITAPLIWLNFHVISLVAIPLNVLLWPFLFVGLLSGLAVALFGWLPVVGSLCGWLCGLNLWAIGVCVWIADRLPLGHFWLPAPSTQWVVTFYCLAAIGSLLTYWRPKYRWTLGAILMIWLFLGTAPWLLGPRGHAPQWIRNSTIARLADSRKHDVDALLMTFIDVGHGTSVLIEFPDGKVWLYDAGHLGSPERSHQEIADVLWHVPTARVDRLFLSHADADHYNAVPGLIERFSIQEIAAPVSFWQHLAPELGTLRQEIQSAGIPMQRVTQGDRWKVGDVEIVVLHPPDNWNDTTDNGNSLTLLVRYAGRTCLLPGDLEKGGLQKLLSQPSQPCDVLMAPHHGSTTYDPTSLFAWCQPKWIIISGGPRATRTKVIDHYSLQSVRPAITHRDGAIQVRIDRQGELSIAHWNVSQWQAFD